MSTQTENQPANVNVRCNQNGLFGCGDLVALPATYYTIGIDRQRVMASGSCTCGLPLSIVRNA